MLVVKDTMLSILSDTQLFIEARNAVFKTRHNRAYYVYECFRHGNRVCKKIIDNLVQFSATDDIPPCLWGVAACGVYAFL